MRLPADEQRLGAKRRRFRGSDEPTRHPAFESARITAAAGQTYSLAFFSFYLEQDMAFMMILMVVFLVALPGGHMGGGALHHSPDQASQSHKSDAAKLVHENTPQSAEYDAVKSNQEKR